MKKKRFIVTQVSEFPHPLHSCGSDELVEGPRLAEDVYGELGSTHASVHTAFAYLWRRFGPPFMGVDPVKQLAGYMLTTPDPDVYLRFWLGSGNLNISVGYAVPQSTINEHYQPCAEWDQRFSDWLQGQTPEGEYTADVYWKARLSRERVITAEAVLGPYPRDRSDDWREGAPLRRRINEALLVALKDLLRPVRVRDAAFNILGFDSTAFVGDAAEPSDYAGCGVPRQAMEELLNA